MGNSQKFSALLLKDKRSRHCPEILVSKLYSLKIQYVNFSYVRSSELVIYECWNDKFLDKLLYTDRLVSLKFGKMRSIDINYNALKG